MSDEEPQRQLGQRPGLGATAVNVDHFGLGHVKHVEAGFPDPEAPVGVIGAVPDVAIDLSGGLLGFCTEHMTSAENVFHPPAAVVGIVGHEVTPNGRSFLEEAVQRWPSENRQRQRWVPPGAGLQRSVGVDEAGTDESNAWGVVQGGDQGGQSALGQSCITVEEHAVTAMRPPEPVVPSGDALVPAQSNDLHIGAVFGHSVGRTIGGAVVDEDRLHLEASAEPTDAVKASEDIVTLVVSDDDHAHVWGACDVLGHAPRSFPSEIQRRTYARLMPTDARPLLFYSVWPLGYVNQEAERKARHFAREGHDVVYVAGIGLRNPRLQSMGKLADRVTRKIREHWSGSAAPAIQQDGLRSAALLVAPPRQLGPVRRLNARWVERQLRAAVNDWPRAVAWVRNATPELVEALYRLRPAVIVYEAVDAHHEGPGMTGRWRERHERAEQALVEQADLVVVTAASLAPRFERWGADVHVVGLGVDLFPWRPRAAHAGSAVLGFLGVLDFRLDVTVLRHLASERPAWRIRLVGPVERGFDPADVADLPNISVEPPVPHALIGEVLAEFDVGLLAYADSPVYRHMSPLKNLEMLAAGRPVVARPTPALEPFRNVVSYATTPEEFLEAAERALVNDSEEAAMARRQIAEGHSWPARLAELSRLLEERLRAEAPAPRGLPPRAG